MVVSADYCLAPELSVLPDQLAGAAEIPLGGEHHFICREGVNPVLAF